MNNNMLHKSNEEALVKGYKAKLQQAQQTIHEMNNQRDNQYRSQKNMQLKYAFTRLKMVLMMRQVVSNMTESKRTGIDIKMHKTVEKWLGEEYLILRYAEEHDVPRQLVKDQLNLEKVLKLKKEKNFNEY